MDQRPSAGRSVLLLVLASALAGVLVAGLLLPSVGSVGLAAKKVSDTFEDLPSDLTIPTLPQRSRIMSADGKLLATVYLNEDRVNVSLAEVPTVMRQAIIATEDSRFYEHNGVDSKGLLRALVANLGHTGSAIDGQGASTLTQQYVKNVLLEKAGTSAERKAATADTIERKLQEARYALELEKKLSKDQILERYLNIAYFGDGVYGVGTAATHYFGIPVSELSLDQAAVLAGLVKNPSAYDPVDNPQNARARRDTVLGRMLDVGFIDQAAHDAAEARPITLDVHEASNGCATSFAPFFCDYILQEAQNDPAFGATADQRRSRLFQGGLTITTTLDSATQAAAQKAVDATIADARVAAATVTIQPGTGKVLALAQNRQYGTDAGQTTVNYATGQGGSGFQAGSTFKIFTLIEALEQGLPLSYSMSSPTKIPPPGDCDAPASGYFRNAGDSEAGTFDLTQATAHSVNTYFVPLLEKLGVLKTARLAEQLGITSIAPNIKAQNLTTKSCSFTLGTYETTPLEMANVVAMLAAHGKQCTTTAIAKVTTTTDEMLDLPAPKCQQVVPAGVADTATDVLTHVITEGTATGADIGRPAAGKTGTTQEFGAAWFVGYVPQLATAVWVGDPRGGSRYPLRGVTGGTGSGHVVYGGGLPATIWRTTMSASLSGVPVEQFAGADPDVVDGTPVAVPDVAGLAAADAVDQLTQNGFEPVLSTARVYDASRAAGLVSRTSPHAGAMRTPTSRVVVYLSNGHAPPPPRPRPSTSPPPATPSAPSPVITLPQVTTSPSAAPGGGTQSHGPPAPQQAGGSGPAGKGAGPTAGPGQHKGAGPKQGGQGRGKP